MTAQLHRNFEIKGRIVSAHTAAGVFDYYEKIGALEQALQGTGFFRCHKSFLVNLRHVDTFNRQVTGLNFEIDDMISGAAYCMVIFVMLVCNLHSDGSVDVHRARGSPRDARNRCRAAAEGGVSRAGRIL